MAVVISEEQGEVDKFRKWDLDIIPHRKLMKEGFLGTDGKRVAVEDAFKSGGTSVPRRHRLRDVAHGLRRAELVDPVSRQAA